MWMIRGKRLLNLLTVVLTVTACSTIDKEPHAKEPEEIENPYFGDYSTDRIRGMWGSCFTSSTSKNPLVPPPLHAIYCDCMVNKVRSRYSQRHLALINNDKELNVIMVDIAQECVDEVIDPIYPQKNKPEAEKTSTYG